MTLDRATVEQMLETIAGDSYLNARDARALAEDWLRKEEALISLRALLPMYGLGVSKLADRIDAALAPQTEEEKP